MFNKQFTRILFWCGILLTMFHFHTNAQDLDAMLAQENEDEVIYTTSTFKSTRAIGLHSIENTHVGALDFRIAHRFAPLNTGPENLWGLDGPAYIRFNLEYGISPRLMAGISRSNYKKTYEIFGKYKIVRQQSGSKNIPISLSAYLNTSAETEDWSARYPGYDIPFTSRLAYNLQLIIARKFKGFSLQANPIFIHKNLVQRKGESNSLFALGLVGKLKISKRIDILGEYVWLPNNQNAPLVGGVEPKSSFSIGVDIETGGHVFQLHLTNSHPLTDSGFIAETNGTWEEGEIRIGFNILRSFTIKK